VSWPKFHLDLGNTGYNPFETRIGVGNVSTLATAWRYRAGSVHGTPALWHGTIYVAGSTSQLPLATIVSAVDTTSGSVIWTKKIPHSDGSLSGVTCSGGSLYVGTNSYVLYSLDARTGSQQWSFFVGGIPSNAIVSGGLVYVAKDSGTVFAVDAGSGNLVWASQNFGTTFGTPALAGGILYEGAQDNKVHALDAATGVEVWSFRTGGQVTSPAAVANGTVYVGSGDYYLYALNAATGALKWKQPLATTGAAPPCPVLSAGVVYSSGKGVVQAFDAKYGTPLWSTALGDHTGSSVLANGVLFVPGGFEYAFYALDAANGSLLWSFTAGSLVSDPIVANGMVYVGSQDGSLYAFMLAA
jgi:outer membrane protein assembly factor BamB